MPATAQTSTAPTRTAPRLRRPAWWDRAVLPGLGLALAVAIVATGLGKLVPLVGGPVFGIVLGAIVAAVRHPGERFRPGIAIASRQVLQLSIVLLGLTLSLSQVVHVGAGSLPVMLGTLAIALGGAYLFGRALKVEGQVRTLIGVGTGICGASAIAAATAVIGAAEGAVAYAIATIFTFNVAAVLLFPAIGHLLGLAPHAFGLWAGTAVNDTSSVVAAAYAYGASAGEYAVVVKLTRSLMIVPICIALAAWHARRSRARAVDLTDGHGDVAADGAPAATGQAEGTGGRLLWKRMVPIFLIGFVLASVVRTVGIIPAGWHGAITETAVFLITTALAGIGLSTRVSVLRAAGVRPLLLGALLWALVAVSSLLLQGATGTI